MKRLMALIFALTLVVCNFSIVSVASFDETDCVSLSKFTGSFVDLVENTELLISGKDEAYYGSADVIADDEATDDAPNTEYNETTATPEGATNRLIVKSTEKLPALDSVGYVYGYNDLHILQFDNRESFQKAYEYYGSLKCVEYVEEDLYLTEAVVDDGVVFESAIEYPTIVQSNLFGYSTAKKDSDGYAVDVGVIDSGVQHDHEFLAGRVVDTGFNSISDNGSAYDDRGHGTHVAGIIVANTLSNVTVYAYKALNSSGSGTSAQVSLAIDAAIEDGMDVLNLSVQMKGFSDTLHEAVARAYNAGITVVVAAGNAGVNLDETQYSPGCFEEAISVMSCSDYRRISDFSNYGKICDFAAPGENILSTYLNNTYKMTSGTSMASPFICAAVTYQLSKDNTLTPDQVEQLLNAQSEPCFGSKSGVCVYPDVKVDFQGVSNAPKFEFDSCRFAGEMRVSISCSSDNVDIYYSMNGDLYKEYTEPFYITQTAHVYAFAVSSLLNMSFVREVNYECYTSDVNEFVLDENNVLIEYNGVNKNISVPTFVNMKNVSGVANTAFANNTTIENINFEQTVTHFFDGAFKGCTALKSVVAPNVTYIGADAFNGCTSLQRLDCTHPSEIGDRAFYNCSALTNMITDSVVKFGDNAFSGCASLLAFSSNLATSFDYSYIEDCTNLQNISIDSVINLPSLKEGETFAEKFPNLREFSANSATSIPDSYFKDCSNLVNVIFDNVIYIYDNAFLNSGLKSGSFKKVQYIGDYAFANTNIDSIPLGNLKEMGLRAFYNCTSIVSVSLNNLTKMGEEAFYNCTSNGLVYLPKITTIPTRAFYNNTSLKSIEYKSTCTTIGMQAFMNCTSLTKVSCGSSSVKYSDRAFYGCSQYTPNIKYLYPNYIGRNVFTGTKPGTGGRVNLSKLTEVCTNGFDGLVIDELILENVTTLYDVPVNSIVLIGKNLTNYTIPINKSAVIYSASSKVLEYCKDNGIEYVEYNGITAKFEEPRVVEGSETNIYFNVIGFNLKFKLYGCNSNHDTSSMVVSGAEEITNFTEMSNNIFKLTIPSASQYKYYYFVVESYYSSSSYPIFTCRSAFVTFNNTDNPEEPDEPVDPPASDTSWWVKGTATKTSYDGIMKNGSLLGYFLITEEKTVEAAISNVYVSNGTMSVTPSTVANGVEIYGTGSILNVYDKYGAVIEQIPIVIIGDVNGDCVMDALDCTVLSECMYEREKFNNDSCWVAADYNRDDVFNVIDFQLVVNDSVELL